MSTALEHAGVEHFHTETPSRRRVPRAMMGPLRVGPAIAGVIALVAWRLSLRQVDIAHLGDYGLPPALPSAWYLALALAIVGAVSAITTNRPSAPIMIGCVVVVAIILYGTVPVLSAQPHYAWVYKHIGVVRYLEVHGKVDPSIDIYNRWPGFFALAAVFSRVVGSSDPETYASWAELAFVLIDMFLVMAAVKIVARDVRIASGAALLFILTNWVGQTYYSPQAFTFVLCMTLIVVLLGQLRASSYSRRLTGLVERMVRTPQLPVQTDTHRRWPRPATLAIVLGLDAVIVASHQLTPYVLLASVALLMAAGVVRPWWVLGAMIGMTIAYLSANLNFIQHNYGLYTSLDPFNNAQVSTFTETPSAGKSFNTNAELLASAALWLGGLLALICLLRRGLGVRALPLAALALAPLAVIFGQNYGGEASLRIILFSSPWWSAVMAWALMTIHRQSLRLVAMLVVALGFAALFVPSFFGQEELNIISPAEVRASEWFYSHARPGSVLVLSAPGFPYKYGGTYPEFRGPEGDSNPNLLTEPAFRNGQLGQRQVPLIAARIREYSRHGYIAFTRDQTAYAEVLGIMPPGAMNSLEAAVARSPEFRLWYGNRDAQIFELVGRAPKRRNAPLGGALGMTTIQPKPPRSISSDPFAVPRCQAGRSLRPACRRASAAPRTDRYAALGRFIPDAALGRFIRDVALGRIIRDRQGR